MCYRLYIASEVWRDMPLERKQEYQSEASRQQVEYLNKMKDYQVFIHKTLLEGKQRKFHGNNFHEFNLLTLIDSIPINEFSHGVRGFGFG